jgi:pimeloyl-ACP methyl ester carboxylesterase
MGGLIGMSLASLSTAGGCPVRRLVLNDIGPTLDAAGLQRIGRHVGQMPHWQNLDEAADAMWAISQGFGPHTRDEWLALSRPQLTPDGDGCKPHYDPGIAVPFRHVTPEVAAAGEALLWQAYDRIKSPTLLLRGADSDLLTPATAQAMTQRGPRATLCEFAGVGHAPTLIALEQRAAVRAFLLGP